VRYLKNIYFFSKRFSQIPSFLKDERKEASETLPFNCANLWALYDKFSLAMGFFRDE